MDTCLDATVALWTVTSHPLANTYIISSTYHTGEISLGIPPVDVDDLSTRRGETRVARSNLHFAKGLDDLAFLSSLGVRTDNCFLQTECMCHLTPTNRPNMGTLMPLS